MTDNVIAIYLFTFRGTWVRNGKQRQLPYIYNHMKMMFHVLSGLCIVSSPNCLSLISVVEMFDFQHAAIIGD